MKDCNNLGRMKIVDIAVESVGSISALQQELVRRGISVSQSAISQARSQSKESLRLDILVGIVEVAFGGDWEKAGKLLKEEFGSKKKK